MAKILVVDTSVADRIRILNALEPEGHTLREEADGRDALALVVEFAPHAVITELVLLGMDGFKLIRSLREQGSTIPIIVQTSLVKDSMRDTCVNLGATAFLRKPVHSANLVQTLRELLAAAPIAS